LSLVNHDFSFDFIIDIFTAPLLPQYGINSTTKSSGSKQNSYC